MHITNHNNKNHMSFSIDYSYNNKRKSEDTQSLSNKRFKADKDDNRKRNNNNNNNADDNFFKQNEDDISCENNIIYFNAGVNRKSIEKLVKIIDTKNQKFKELLNNPTIKTVEPNPLYLHITSYGGDLFACFKAIDAIKRSTVPIYTVVDGYAASAATLMSIVGKKRYMTPNSYMLIHQLSSGAMGKWWEIKDDYKNCEVLMKKIHDLYISHSKLTNKELEEYLTHDLWWEHAKCLDTGLIDELY